MNLEKMFLNGSVVDILVGEVTFDKIGEITVSMPPIDDDDVYDILYFAGRTDVYEIPKALDRRNLVEKVLSYSIKNNKFLGFLALLFNDDRFKKIIENHYDGAVHYSYSENYSIRDQMKKTIIDEINKLLHPEGYELSYNNRVSRGLIVQDIVASENELQGCTMSDIRIREQLWDEISTAFLKEKEKTGAFNIPNSNDSNWNIWDSIRKSIGYFKIKNFIECAYASGFVNYTLTQLGIDEIEKDKAEREEEKKKMLDNLNNKLLNYPSELSPYIDKFRADYPINTKTAFIMMQFSKTPAHDNIVKEIKRVLKKHDIIGLRADDKEYSDDLFPNVRTYMHCCDFGIAVFERLTADDFNPNVSLEVGYMMGLFKSVCLLKDQTLKNLQTDLVGKLYKSFDPQNISGTIETEIEKWLKDKGII